MRLVQEVRVRRGIAASLFLANAVIGVLLVLSDALIYFTWGPVQAGLYLAASGVAGRAAWGKPSWTLVWLVLAAFAMFPFGVMMRVYGFVDLFAFYYHLQEGITANSLADAYRPMIVVAGALLVFVLVVYHLTQLLHIGRWPVVAGVGVLLAINPVIGAAITAYGVTLHPADLANRIAAPDLLHSDSRPDLVVIYMEGTEQGYGQTDVFGDIYAPIRQLYPEAVTFTNIDQIEGTGWSIAGITASQCGLPLLPNKFVARNLFFQQTDFLTAHVCLSDILAERGYEVGFYEGAEAGFAGTANFTSSHHYDTIIDSTAIAAEFTPEEYAAAFSVWVVDDQMLYDSAKAHYAAMIGMDRPLAMVVETFGPHGPDHVLSRECGDTGRAVRLADMKPVVQCLTTQTVAFIRHIQSLRAARGRDTVFVILSDHLSHDRHLQHWLVQKDRRNTALILGPSRAGTVINKHGSMIDIFPTLLDYLGLLAPGGKAGLGVSLFSDQPTLVEELGIPRLNDQLRYDEAIRNAVWQDNTAG
jgi:phosphoglycerol transferase